MTAAAPLPEVHIVYAAMTDNVVERTVIGAFASREHAEAEADQRTRNLSRSLLAGMMLFSVETLRVSP